MSEQTTEGYVDPEQNDEDFSVYDCATCGCSLLPTGHCWFCERVEREGNCMDCGMCDDCIARAKAFYEEMEAGEHSKQAGGL